MTTTNTTATNVFDKIETAKRLLKQRIAEEHAAAELERAAERLHALGVWLPPGCAPARARP